MTKFPIEWDASKDAPATDAEAPTAGAMNIQTTPLTGGRDGGSGGDMHVPMDT